MKNLFRFIFFLSVLIITVCIAAPSEKIEASINTVALMYKNYPPAKSPKDPVISNQDYLELHKYFGEKLAHQIVKDGMCAQNQRVCKLDFDPIYNSQDNESVKVSVVNENKTIFAILDYGQLGEMKIQYNFLKEGGAYKIKDIIYPNKQSLSMMLR